MRASFWDGRRVALTGHTGFKGAWFAHWLLAWKAQVSGFALAPDTQPNLYDVLDLAKRMPSTIGDVRDRAAVQQFIAESRPEIVFHLAAQPLVRRSYVDPVETYGSNVMGLVHLLDAVRQTPSVRAIVVVTSDKCYEIADPPVPHREGDRLGGRDPYSNSKACAELVTASFRDSYFSQPGAAAMASGRAGNVIGGGDWSADRLIPDLVRALRDDRATVLRHPEAIRPWQHVFEPLAGYVQLAEALIERGHAVAGAWNFGPDHDDARTVGEIATQFATLTGARPWIYEPSDGKYETGSLRVDATKAQAELGWRPRLTVDEAIALTATWYRAHLDGRDVRALCDEQLDGFLAAAC
jgi:CDP-glucose 4,6-dehydratase